MTDRPSPPVSVAALEVPINITKDELVAVVSNLLMRELLKLTKSGAPVVFLKDTNCSPVPRVNLLENLISSPALTCENWVERPKSSLLIPVPESTYTTSLFWSDCLPTKLKTKTEASAPIMAATRA